MRTLAIALLTLAPLLTHAEGGWLLMVPPSLPETFGFEPTVPVIKWQQEGAYDTASSCEASLTRYRRERHELVMQAIRQAEEKEAGSPTDLDRMKRVLLLVDQAVKQFGVTAVASGRCLPASSVPIK